MGYTYPERIAQGGASLLMEVSNMTQQPVKCAHCKHQVLPKYCVELYTFYVSAKLHRHCLVEYAGTIASGDDQGQC